MTTPLRVRWLGRVPYREALAVQQSLFEHGTGRHLLLLEHPHVFTHGRTADLATNLRCEPAAVGAELVPVKRGGDITYHGPGQVVGYPILDLDNFFTDIHKYLRLLEEMIIRTLAEYGLKGERSKGETGVWLDVGTPGARKICAMGVRASRWVTMHGFALNVNTDLSYFDLMIPCGIRGKGVTSLSRELGRHVPMDEVKQKLTSHFLSLFEAT